MNLNEYELTLFIDGNPVDGRLFECFASIKHMYADNEEDISDAIDSNRRVFMEWDMTHRLDGGKEEWDKSAWPALREIKAALNTGIGNNSGGDPMRSGVVRFLPEDRSYMAHARVCAVRHLLEEDTVGPFLTYHKARAEGLSVLESWVFADVFPYYDWESKPFRWGREHSNLYGLFDHQGSNVPVGCNTTGARNILLSDKRTRHLLTGGLIYESFYHQCEDDPLIGGMIAAYNRAAAGLIPEQLGTPGAYGGWTLTRENAYEVARLIVAGRQAALGVAVTHAKRKQLATQYNLAA